MTVGHSTRLRSLYRQLAPVYAPVRPLWAGTTNRAAERYVERVALPAALHPTANVLDLGCGPGTNLGRLRRLGLPFAHYVGFDLSRAMLAVGGSRLSQWGEFISGDAHWLPFAAGRFDVVLSTWMFSHLAEPLRVVREARRLLRPGGWLIVACFARPWGVPGALLHMVEPFFMMRSLRPEGVKNWPDLVDVKTFAHGINLVARMRKNVWCD